MFQRICRELICIFFILFLFFTNCFNCHFKDDFHFHDTKMLSRYQDIKNNFYKTRKLLQNNTINTKKISIIPVEWSSQNSIKQSISQTRSNLVDIIPLAMQLIIIKTLFVWINKPMNFCIFITRVSEIIPYVVGVMRRNERVVKN